MGRDEDRKERKRECWNDKQRGNVRGEASGEMEGRIGQVGGREGVILERSESG